MKLPSSSFFFLLITLAFFFYKSKIEAANILQKEPNDIIVTVSDYVAFLNAVAKDDPFHLYEQAMGRKLQGSIIRKGKPGSYFYYFVAGEGENPVSYVDALSGMHYCNWLQHGQPCGKVASFVIEDGAYSINQEGITLSNYAMFRLTTDEENKSLEISSSSSLLLIQEETPSLSMLSDGDLIVDGSSSIMDQMPEILVLVSGLMEGALCAEEEALSPASREVEEATRVDELIERRVPLSNREVIHSDTSIARYSGVQVAVEADCKKVLKATAENKLLELQQKIDASYDLLSALFSSQTDDLDERTVLQNQIRLFEMEKNYWISASIIPLKQGNIYLRDIQKIRDALEKDVLRLEWLKKRLKEVSQRSSQKKQTNEISSIIDHQRILIEKRISYAQSLSFLDEAMASAQQEERILLQRSILTYDAIVRGEYLRQQSYIIENKQAASILNTIANYFLLAGQECIKKHPNDKLTRYLLNAATTYADSIIGESRSEEGAATLRHKADCFLSAAQEVQKKKPNIKIEKTFLKAVSFYEKALLAAQEGHDEEEVHLNNAAHSLYLGAEEAKKENPNRRVVKYYLHSARLYKRYLKLIDDNADNHKKRAIGNAAHSLYSAAEEASSINPCKSLIDHFLEAAIAYEQSLLIDNQEIALILHKIGNTYYQIALEKIKNKASEKVISHLLKAVDFYKKAIDINNQGCTTEAEELSSKGDISYLLAQDSEEDSEI